MREFTHRGISFRVLRGKGAQEMSASANRLRAVRYVLLLAPALLLGVVLLFTGDASAGRLADTQAGLSRGLASAPGAPLNDAYLELVPGASGNCAAPANGGTTMVGCRFALDMLLDAGSHVAVQQQSYLTFTYTLIQNAR